MEKLKLKQVFTPGGQPSVTYVSREHLQLEAAVEKALARGYAIIVVTGPTKSGKTVLCNHVLSKSGDSVTIEGGQVRGEGDFWSQIAQDLDVGTEKIRRESGAANSENGVGLKANLGVFEGSFSDKSGVIRTTERTIKYDVNIPKAVLDELIRRDASLLVDDFHYIPQSDQKGIIQALKGAVFKGLSVILLAVPHRAFDPMTVEQEVEGRFKHIEIPPWDMDDLIQIPERGFRALNILNDSKINNAICSEGFGNPLLVQEICTELCIRNGIFETNEFEAALDLSKLPDALSDIAKSKGFPKYSKLKAGPDARKKRQLRQFRDGSSHDKYAAILKAISAVGPKSRTSYDEIRTALQSLLIPTSMPAKHEITSALINMSKIAREKIDGEPPIEWVTGDDVLVITDPFLLFYMKWAENHEAPGSQFT